MFTNAALPDTTTTMSYDGSPSGQPTPTSSRTSGQASRQSFAPDELKRDCPANLMVFGFLAIRV